MGSATKEPQRLLCWTVCAYRKPGMDEGSYHKYMSEVHAPLVKDLMVQYGMLQWSMVSLPHPKSHLYALSSNHHQADITY